MTTGAVITGAVVGAGVWPGGRGWPGMVVTTGPAPATTLNELSTVCSADGILGLHLQHGGERLSGGLATTMFHVVSPVVSHLVPTWISPVNTPSE